MSNGLPDGGAPAVLVHGPECADLAHAAAPGAHGVKHVLTVAELREAMRALSVRAAQPGCVSYGYGAGAAEKHAG